MVTPKKVMVALAVAILGMTGLAGCSSTATIGEYIVPSDLPGVLDKVWDNKESIDGVSVVYKRPNGERYLCIFDSDAHYCWPIDGTGNRDDTLKLMDRYDSGQEWFLDMAESAESNAYDIQDSLGYYIVISVTGDSYDDSCYIYTGRDLSSEDRDLVSQLKDRCTGDFFD